MKNTITTKHTSPKKVSKIRRRTDLVGLVKFPFQPLRHLKTTETYFGVEKNARHRCFCARTNIALAGVYLMVNRLEGTVYFWNVNFKAIVSLDVVSADYAPRKFKYLGFFLSPSDDWGISTFHGGRCSVYIVSRFHFNRRILFTTALDQEIMNNYSGHTKMCVIQSSVN